MPVFLLALGGCSTALNGPIDLFHNLEGGTIAAQRPPPPGSDQPYPKLGTVPPRPVVPDAAYRRSLEAQLATERDRNQRIAADAPIEPIPPPPGPPRAAPPDAAPPTANATLDTAEAPPAPAPPPIAAIPPPRDTAVATAPEADDTGPPEGAALTIAGAPMDMSGLPPIPDAPPPPATFEGVAAEPAPTRRVISIQQPPPAGTRVFFGAGSTILSQSQNQAVRDFAKSSGGRGIEIIGFGDAGDDTPEGQATAIALALGRARTLAEALVGQHVPADTIRIGANAFGRGAVLRLL